MNRIFFIRFAVIFLLILAVFEASLAEEPLIGVFEKVTLESGGVSRDYRMVVPPNYSPDRPIGVIFGYHGAGPFSFLTQLKDTGFEDLAEEAYWITVSVAAIPGLGWDQNLNMPENKEVILVRDVLGLLRSKYKIDNNRIYAFGVSGGTSLIRLLAYALPEEFAAIVGVMSGNKVLLEPHPDSTHAAMFVGGSKDGIFTRQGLIGIANQFPTLYKWDKEYYDKMEPIGVTYFMNDIIENYNKSGNELYPYFLNIGHEFPADDRTTSPKTSYMYKAVRFMNTHPKGYKVKVYPAPYKGEPFVDEFDGESELPAFPRWRTFNLDAEGRFSDLQGYRFQIKDGKLFNTTNPVESMAKPVQPGACFMYTDFFSRPFSWKTSFVPEKIGKETVIYPCIFRDMQGRVIFLALTKGGWEWGRAESHIAFHSGYDEKIHSIVKGKLRLRSGREYGVEVEYKDGTPHWTISQGDKVIAEQSLPEGIPFLDEVEVGLGVKCLPEHVVAFDYAGVTRK